MRSHSMKEFFVQCLLIFCSIGISTVTSDDLPSLPQMPDTFQVHVMGTLAKSGRTFHAIEYFNAQHNEGSIVIDSRVENKAIHMQFIYNFNKKTVRTVLNGLCVDGAITQSNSFSFGNITLFTTGALIGLFPSLKKEKETTEMDNINCQKFTGVVDDEGFRAKANVELYWSNPGAAFFPNCPKDQNCTNWTVPIRLIVTNLKDSKKEFRNEYKFYDFKPFVDYSVFEVPPGTICVDVKSEKNLPTLPDEFSTGFEFIYSDNSMLSGKIFVRTSKDSDPTNFDHLFRIDEDLSNGKVSYHSEIYDYNSGVKYMLDRNSGECNVSNITSDGFIGKDTNKQGAMNKLIDFYLNTDNSTMIYIGKRIKRSLLCDVWTGSKDGMNMELYFEALPPKKPDSSTAGFVQVPIFMNISISAGDVVVPFSEKYFYNFDVIPPKWSDFDITTCIPNYLYKLIFQLEMTGSFDYIIKNDIEKFKRAVRNTISGIANISPIRIQKAEIDHVESNTVLFTAVLLEDVYNAGKFGNPAEIPKSNVQVYELLDYMIAKGDLEVVFAVDSARKSFKVVGIRDDVILDSMNTEDGYFRKDFSPHQSMLIVGNSAEITYTKLSIFECARRCIHNMAFRCDSYSYCLDDGQCVLARDHVEYLPKTSVSDVGRCTTYSRNFTNDFDNEIGLTIQDSGEQTTMFNLKIEDCSRICADKSNLSFFCEGFDYCMNSSSSSSCLFHSTHRFEVPAESLRPDDNCIQYSRNYIDDFRVFKNKTIKAQPFREIKEGSAQECARNCALAADRCVAFEMCTLKQGTARATCMLLEDGRSKDNFQLVSSKECDHYQRIKFINKPPEKSIQTDSYSDGSMAGIGIGMTLVGLVVGGGIAVVVLRKKVVRP